MECLKLQLLPCRQGNVVLPSINLFSISYTLSRDKNVGSDYYVEIYSSFFVNSDSRILFRNAYFSRWRSSSSKVVLFV
jgi:hypothetical protein